MARGRPNVPGTPRPAKANDTSASPPTKAAPARKRIGELLVEAGLVNVEQVVTALAYQRVHGGRIGSALVALGMLKEEQLHGALARQLGIATADLETLAPPRRTSSRSSPRTSSGGARWCR